MSASNQGAGRSFLVPEKTVITNTLNSPEVKDLRRLVSSGTQPESKQFCSYTMAEIISTPIMNTK